MEKAMPNFFENLAYIEKCRREEFFSFKGFVDNVQYSITLLGSETFAKFELLKHMTIY